MNKLLLVESIKKIDNGEYILECKNNAKLVITGNATLHYYEPNNKDLSLELSDNSALVFNNFYVVSNDIKIDINLKNNATLNYNMLIINEGDNKVTINVNIKGNKNKCYLNIKVINKNKSSKIDVVINGIINAHTIDNEFLENVKGLLLNDDYIKISPNINVLTNEVTANHLVTIGSFSKAELFYLLSKGISLNNAKNLILKGFITSILSSPLQKYLNMEVITIE